MAKIGEIPEPSDFRYREVFLKGKPQHTKTDPLRRKHPSMDVGKRAKIFAPFDALRGFSEQLTEICRNAETAEAENQEDLPDCPIDRQTEFDYSIRNNPETGTAGGHDHVL